MKYEIFGKKIKINVENYEVKNILNKELSIYPTYETQSFDVIINFVNKIVIEEVYSNSPSSHLTFKHGFLAHYGSNKIYYKKTNYLEVFVEINIEKNFFNKFRSMGFRDNLDNVGQILHELVLVPLIIFDKKSALIHASSMIDKKNNRTLLFGGTGGVGKTSLELLLCRELNYSFISDDIAVVTNNKKVHPNLSYPKIYAYNVVKNNDIYKAIFRNRSLLDRLQWSVVKQIKGANKVRRAIAPNEIYNSIENRSNTIDDYYILMKTKTVEKINIEELDHIKASKLTLDIIKNEYHTVLQHIIWHEYNASLMGITPIITIEEIYSNWSNLYENILKDVKCYVVKIPINIEHKSFLAQMKNIINI